MKNESFHVTGGARVGVAQRSPLDPQKYREKTPKTCMNGENRKYSPKGIYYRTYLRATVSKFILGDESSFRSINVPRN